MRKSLMMSAAVLGLALAAPAFAQTGSPGTTSPSAPNAGSLRPQPPNSVPPGGTAAAQPGSGYGTGGADAGEEAPAGRGHARHLRHARRGHGSEAAMTDTGARPGNEIGTGNSLPKSDHASNITRADTRSDIAPRLPNPDARGDTPEAYLAAAQRALAARRTGAAQEALERAETRLLDRSTDPTQPSRPDTQPMVEHVSAARRALAGRDYASAREAIRAAMSMRGETGSSSMNSPGMGAMPMGGQGMGTTPMGSQDMGTMPMGGAQGPSVNTSGYGPGSGALGAQPSSGQPTSNPPPVSGMGGRRGTTMP